MNSIIPYFSFSVIFENKLKSFLTINDLINNQALLDELFNFLEIYDILIFASSCQQLHKILKIQSIQLKILRAKINFLENKKQSLKINSPFNLVTIFYSPYFPDVSIKNSQKQFQNAKEQLQKFNQGIRFYKYLQKQGFVDNKESFNRLLKKKGFEEFISFYDNFHSQQQEFARMDLESKNNINEPHWKNVKQNELKQFEQYKTSLQKERQEPLNLNKRNPPIFNPYISKFEALQKKLAKQDYIKRKQKRMRNIQIRKNQLPEEFSDQITLGKMFNSDSCTREVIKSIQSQDQGKIEMQKINIQKLKMPKVPKVKDVQKLLSSPGGLQEGQRLMVMKKTVVNKIYEKIQSFWQLGPMFI